MTKEDIYKVVYDLLSEIYVCEGANSTERTFGEIMGIMSMAAEVENIVISEKPEVPDHDGCKDCKWLWKNKEDHPCSGCKQNYFDKWEERDE